MKSFIRKIQSFYIVTFDVREEKTLKVFFKHNTGRLFVISIVTQVCLLLSRTNSNEVGPVDYLLLIKGSVSFTSSVRVNPEEKNSQLSKLQRSNFQLQITKYGVIARMLSNRGNGKWTIKSKVGGNAGNHWTGSSCSRFRDPTFSGYFSHLLSDFPISFLVPFRFLCCTPTDLSKMPIWISDLPA